MMKKKVTVWFLMQPQSGLKKKRERERKLQQQSFCYYGCPSQAKAEVYLYRRGLVELSVHYKTDGPNANVRHYRQHHNPQHLTAGLLN